MAEIFKFFNSAPGDERWHYASDFADYFGGVLSDGILHTDKQIDLGLRVRVVPNTLTTKVAVGKAIIKGYAYENTTELVLKHDIPEPTLKRIDRIVLRLDLSNSSRYVKLFVKKGASATSPIAPTLQRDQYIHELSLAQVLVRENTTQLIETDLKDERMIESLCGLVSSIISVPTTQFQEQWDAWFKSVQDEGFAPYTDTGFKENLKTTDKTTLVNAINEVFTSGNNVKKNVVDTLLSLDNTLPINTNSPWDKITASLPNVSGKSPMNVFIQPTEPIKKEGIWFKTAESNKPDVEDYKYDTFTESVTQTAMTNISTGSGNLIVHKEFIYTLTKGGVIKFNPKTNIFTNILSDSRIYPGELSFTNINDDFYIVVGSKQLLKFNVVNNSKEEITLAVPYSLMYIHAVSSNKIVNLEGGGGDIIDLNTKQSKRIPVPTEYRYISHYFGYKNTLFIKNNTGTLYSFNVSSETWSSYYISRSPIGDLSCVNQVNDTDFYQLGGSYNSTSYDIYRYYEPTMVWSKLGVLPFSTTGHKTVEVNNSIYSHIFIPENNKFHKIDVSYNYIKGVNIDNSKSTYSTSLLNLKGYKSLQKIKNTFDEAYISLDGRTKLRGINTYYGNGSSWILTKSK